MTARERESAQEFLGLLRELTDAKPNAATARVLLLKSAEHIECLLTALGDQETELAEARHGGEADCGCCDVSYPREELTDGLCPTCFASGCGEVRPSVAAEFAVDLGSPWLCVICGAACSARCWANISHPVDVPICANCSAADPESPSPDARFCASCVAAGQLPDGVVPFVAPPGEARPPEWQCSRCQMRFPGRKPEDGVCRGCEDLSAFDHLNQCSARHERYRCNTFRDHTGLDHVEWRQDGTIAARWPAARVLWGGVTPRLAPVPDLAGGAR